MNIFESLNKIDDRKSLRESFTDGKYCIVAVTNDGKRKFYKDGKFIDDCKTCTVFTDLDEARDVWHEIDKSGFRRVFVPNWSENMFGKSIDEKLVKDKYYDSLATNEPKIYLPTDKGSKVEVAIGTEKQDEDDWDIYVEIRDNGDFCFEIPSSRLADEIGEIRNPRLTRLTYERAEELCDQIHSYFEDVEQDDIYNTLVNKLRCNKTKVEKFWNAPDLQEGLEGEYHIQYCPSCGAMNEYSDSEDNGSWVRYTCRACDNTWDIDKPKKVETMIESAPLAANEYKLTYYENTAGRDRRSETFEDIEDDWHEITFRADSDLDAWLNAFETVKGDTWEDYMETDPTEDEIEEYFNDADWSDGSPILIKLESSDNVLFDSGYDKESWANEFIGYDDEYDYDDEEYSE